jgi:hypothetical protein
MEHVSIKKFSIKSLTFVESVNSCLTLIRFKQIIDVDEVFPGQLVGIKTKYPKNLLRQGTIVCTVTKEE